jgi:hypothetical protein
MLRRLERFDLQNVASEILKPYMRKDKNGVLQFPSVCKCLKVPRKKFVEIRQSHRNGRHYYAGLVLCHSVWDCLPCAVKVSEERAADIKQAVETWEGMGNTVVMVTFTFPHYENQACAPLREKFGKARRTMKNRKSWKRLMSALGYVGDINRTEVTISDNGFHIHCHTLLFFTGNVSLTAVSIYPLWAMACEASGLMAPSFAHGVKVSTPKEMAEYIIKQDAQAPKWTIQAEMTKGHTKRGRKDSMTPFDLLRAHRDTTDEKERDKYRGLFVQYSKAFKGTRQLVWSDGLRDLLGLGKEKTEEEIVNNVDEHDILYAMIDTAKLWPVIRKLNKQGKDLRGLLIEAANQGEDKFESVLSHIQTLAGFTELPF